jgi:hypothetical protein
MNGDLRFLLMDADLTEPQGFVLREDKPRVHYSREENQYHGFTTTGEPLFSRKGMQSADGASKRKGFRMVAVGYFGVPPREGMTAVQSMVARETERNERASA